MCNRSLNGAKKCQLVTKNMNSGFLHYSKAYL